MWDPGKWNRMKPVSRVGTEMQMKRKNGGNQGCRGGQGQLGDNVRDHMADR